MENIENYFQSSQTPNVDSIATIRGRVLRSLQGHLLDSGFKQLMPVLMSPITDPLNHAVYPAEIQYEQRRLKLTASMIFHKQLALAARGGTKKSSSFRTIFASRNRKSKTRLTICSNSRNSISKCAVLRCMTP
ncbi:hypothetical protein [Burkholderia sp. AW49-1]